MGSRQPSTKNFLKRKVLIKPFENKNYYTSGRMLRLNIYTMATKRCNKTMTK
jgi:hypothetical protein